MENVKSRRSAGKKTVTKQAFAKLLQNRLNTTGLDVNLIETQNILAAVIDEIRQQVRDGNRVLVSDFGFFYQKKMRPRKVKGGILPGSFANPFIVPAKIKIGFSSTPSGDISVGEHEENRLC